MISIIIPTYNERENIGRLVPAISGALKESGMNGEIIVVDDSSPDGTSDLVKGLEKRFPVRLVRRPGKLGLSSAVLEGFRHARGDILGVMDADFSHPVKKIPELVKPIMSGKADIAVGSRKIPGGGTRGWSLFRIIMSGTAGKLASGLTGVRDPMSGFFFLRKDVIKGARLNPRGYKIGLEIMVKGRYTKIVEVPFVFRDRKMGSSKMSAGEIFNYLLHVMGLYRYKLMK